MPYLSPDSLPVETCLIEIEIPNDEKLRLAVMAQIYILSWPRAWEMYGAVTPDEAAAAMLSVYDQITYCEPPMISVSAYSNTSQNPAGATFTRVTFGLTDYNVGDAWLTSDNYFLPNQEGRYKVSTWLYFSNSPATAILVIVKNGVVIARSQRVSSSPTEDFTLLCTTEVELDGVDDYVLVQGYTDASTPIFYKPDRQAGFVASGPY